MTRIDKKLDCKGSLAPQNFQPTSKFGGFRRRQQGLGIWSGLIVIVITLQWLYLCVLAGLIFNDYRNLKEEVLTKLPDSGLEGAKRRVIVGYFSDLLSNNGNGKALGRWILIDREKGINKPSRVTLRPTFKENLAFGLNLTYQPEIKFDIAARKVDKPKP